MSEYLNCLIYLLFYGLMMFFVGRILPKKWFDASKFPYRQTDFEKKYEKHKNKIRRWKLRLPDMSRIFPQLIPSKRIDHKPDAEMFEEMITETCIAEFIHTVNMFLGFSCLLVNDGTPGWVMGFANALLGNLPFIIIQRFNRPRLVRIYNRMKKTEGVNADEEFCLPKEQKA